MWRLKDGSVTLCLDDKNKPIKLGQGGYGSVYLVRVFPAMIQSPVSGSEISGKCIAHINDSSAESANGDVR